VQEIAEWLDKLGMSEYAQRFAENGIGVAALRHLTDQDLKDIGVLLGHRRVMLAAIGELGGPAAPLPAREATVGPKPQNTAERRQVTVMFSDLVGSTALSAQMDPEDLREIISAYQNCVAETVQRFGGFVAKYMGDGVLVYFGYPEAHEYDAERSVQAGLELIKEVTAPRVVANPRGHCDRRSCRGRPHRSGRGAGARHCRRDAEPRRASASNRRAEYGVDRREPPKNGRQSLRDTRPWDERPQRYSRTGACLGGARPSSVASRFEALHASGLTELVGREEELDCSCGGGRKRRTAKAT
jgi:hypothetical protein